MKTQIEKHFSGITDEDEKHIKQIFKKVRKNTENMLKAEANRLRGKGI